MKVITQDIKEIEMVTLQHLFTSLEFAPGGLKNM